MNAEDVRTQLLEIAKTCSSFRQGMREIKKVLLGFLPFATRIAEVVFEPRESKSLERHEFFGAIEAITR